MRFPVFQPQILRVVLKTYGMLSFLDFLYSFNMGREKSFYHLPFPLPYFLDSSLSFSFSPNLWICPLTGEDTVAIGTCFRFSLVSCNPSAGFFQTFSRDHQTDLQLYSVTHCSGESSGDLHQMMILFCCVINWEIECSYPNCLVSELILQTRLALWVSTLHISASVCWCQMENIDKKMEI